MKSDYGVQQIAVRKDTQFPSARDRFGFGLGQNAQNLHRDIVRTAALQGQLHQDGAALSGIVAFHGRLEFLIAHNAPQTVRTQKKIVGVLQGHCVFGSLHSYLDACSQRGCEYVPLRMFFCIFGADNASLDQSANIGVVASQA